MRRFAGGVRAKTSTSLTGSLSCRVLGLGSYHMAVEVGQLCHLLPPSPPASFSLAHDYCPLAAWQGLSHSWVVSYPSFIARGEWVQQVQMSWAAEPQAPSCMLLTACTCMPALPAGPPAPAHTPAPVHSPAPAAAPVCPPAPVPAPAPVHSPAHTAAPVCPPAPARTAAPASTHIVFTWSHLCTDVPAAWPQGCFAQ